MPRDELRGAAHLRAVGASDSSWAAAAVAAGPATGDGMLARRVVFRTGCERGVSDASVFAFQGTIGNARERVEAKKTKALSLPLV